MTPPLSDRLRARTERLTRAIGEGLARAHIHPDALSLLGIGFTGAAAWCIVNGAFLWAAFWTTLGGLCDVADGATARALGSPRPFGALLDSTLDRYADGFLFGALSYYFAQRDQFGAMLLALTALTGSYAVSYIRARAASADIAVSVKIGAFSRLERMVVLIVAFGFPMLMVPALALLAAGTHFTAIQRLAYVRRHTEEK
ncbi:MAG: CDP-alcohol phosphatidyltransferase family protein [Phototrophicaceae bacterium]